MSDEPQSFSNHTRLVPGFHYLLLGMLAVNVVFATIHLVKFFYWTAAFNLVVAISLVMLAWYERTFAMTVQDRVIRLEERLRIDRLCPDLATRAQELRRGQFVALRFASDDEFPDLVRTVLDEKISSGKEIKSKIRNWRADHLRA